MYTQAWVGEEVGACMHMCAGIQVAGVNSTSPFPQP